MVLVHGGIFAHPTHDLVLEEIADLGRHIAVRLVATVGGQVLHAVVPDLPGEDDDLIVGVLLGDGPRRMHRYRLCWSHVVPPHPLGGFGKLRTYSASSPSYLNHS